MIGPFSVGDVPAQAILIEFDGGLEDYDGATVSVINPVGTSTTIPGTLDVDLETVTANWPDTGSIFNRGGIYTINVTLSTSTGQSVHVFGGQFVVEGFTGWHTLGSARAEWRNALDDVQLARLLHTAREQCATYAPALAAGTYAPTNYLQAQLMQARNILNASKTDPSDGADSDLYVIRPYPMDRWVKALLRPPAAYGRFGGVA